MIGLRLSKSVHVSDKERKVGSLVDTHRETRCCPMKKFYRKTQNEQGMKLYVIHFHMTAQHIDRMHYHVCQPEPICHRC